MGPKYSVRKTSWVGSAHSTKVGATNQPSASSAVPPASTVQEALFLIRSSAAACLAKARASITAPPKVDRSVTSPYWMPPTVAASRSRRPPSQSDLGRYARDAAEHFWPWYSYA